MAIDEEKKQFAAHVVDLMQVVGPAYSRRMFGGHGIFLDGLMFALIADNTLYLKVDDVNRGDFEALGLLPFTYQMNARTARLGYYQAPEEAMEDLQLLREWGAAAFEVAMRAAAGKRKSGSASKARQKPRKKDHL